MIAEGLTSALKSSLVMLATALVATACSSGPEASLADAPKASDIRALRWLAPGADKVKFLTETAPACESMTDSAEIKQLRNLGRLAFESPALLGGSAARMELSCASCHREGRDNPDFFLEGLSGDPGTADVTSSVMSKVRGDGSFNPVVIPDLAARSGKQIRDRTSAEFRAKVYGLVVEEFDGQEPPPAVFDALVAYMDGLTTCPAWIEIVGAPSAQGDLYNARAAAEAADRLRASSPDAARFYVRAARYSLRRVYERFTGPEMADIRERLVELSRTLAARMDADGATPITGAGDWSWLESETALRQDRSLYSPEVLATALASP